MNSWLQIGLSNAALATLLAVGVWLVSRRIANPRVTILLWAMVLVKLIAPPLIGLPVDRWVQQFSQAISAAVPQVRAEKLTVVSSEANRETTEIVVAESIPMPDVASEQPVMAIDPPPMWTLADALERIGQLWLAGSLLWLALAVRRIVQFHRLLRRAKRAPRALCDEVGRLAKAFGLQRAPQVRIVERPLGPLVWTIWGPGTIVLPRGLCESLSAEQQTTLLAHELAHLARPDRAVRWLELAAIGLYWWYPLAWSARRRIEEATEECCDAQVISLLPELRRAYAETMLATIEFLAGAPRWRPLGASGFSQVPLLKRRIEMVIDGPIAQSVGWPLRVALACLALAVLPLSLQTVSADPPEVIETDAPLNLAPPANEADQPAPPAEPHPAPPAAAQPEPQPAPQDKTADHIWDTLGLRVEVVPREEFREFKTHYHGGLRVIEVRPKSPAAREGLRKGDVLVGLHKFETVGLRNIEQILNHPSLDKNGRIKFWILRDDGASYGTYFGHLKSTDEKQSEVHTRLDLEDVVLFSESGDREFRAELISIQIPHSEEAQASLRSTQLKVEAAAANHVKMLAAKDQLTAVTDAWEKHASTLEQLLKAQQLAADASVAYHRSLCDLNPDRALAEVGSALAILEVSNAAMVQAKKTWSQVHQLNTVAAAGGETQGEILARDQYFRFKSTTNASLNELSSAEIRLRYDRDGKVRKEPGLQPPPSAK